MPTIDFTVDSYICTPYGVSHGVDGFIAQENGPSHSVDASLLQQNVQKTYIVNAVIGVFVPQTKIHTTIGLLMKQTKRDHVVDVLIASAGIEAWDSPNVIQDITFTGDLVGEIIFEATIEVNIGVVDT